MTIIESLSELDSSMEEDTRQTLAKAKQRHLSSTANHRLSCQKEDVGNEDDDDEECEVEAWETLSKSFKEVQSVLDQNKALIQQVNENHQSKVPDNLVKNVVLIREINGNISKVMAIYADLSVNFSNMVQQRRPMTKNNSGSCNSKVESSDS